jgi:phage terminase large subunit-like protein
MVLAGRGWGKTRTGAEDAAYFALWHEGVRIAVVAPTQSDARDTCVEGVSGLLSVIPRECIQSWNRSLGELILVNGSRFKLFSADEPERLRGPQHHRAWADELAAWKRREAFDQLMMGLRLGKNPKLVVTTTPKPVPLIKELAGRAGQDVYLTCGKSEENAAHLAAGVLEDLRARYGQSVMARQELDAEIVEDMQGALWRREDLNSFRVKVAPECERIVVAIDPAVTSNAKSDETGIIAAARGKDGHFYVLADASGTWAPESWAAQALALYEQMQADVIVGEVNEGGDLIARMLHMIDPYAPFKPVRALKAKAARAWPVAALYARGLVHHVGTLAKLEDQMCRFTAEGFSGGSPDRVDALVWALSELQAGAGNAPRLRTT